MNELCFCWETSQQEMFVWKYSPRVVGNFLESGNLQLFDIRLCRQHRSLYWDVDRRCWRTGGPSFPVFPDNYWLTGIFTAVPSACVQILIGIDLESQAHLDLHGDRPAPRAMSGPLVIPVRPV